MTLISEHENIMMKIIEINIYVGAVVTNRNIFQEYMNSID
jgi:hypothetical protein